MSKSVYSLVLTDEIVRAADSLAYKLGVSRSALIDRILAEHLSVQTPEGRIRSIMENFSQLFDEDIFRLTATASDGGMQIRSPLPYKYKPTIRYSVDLSGDGEHLGKLKISFRTQNSALTRQMSIFWQYFAKLEGKYLSPYARIVMSIDNDKMIRVLNMPFTLSGDDEFTPDKIAQAIADYVRFIDRMIKIYFEYSGDGNTVAVLLDNEYANRMKTCRIFV